MILHGKILSDKQQLINPLKIDTPLMIHHKKTTIIKTITIIIK